MNFKVGPLRSPKHLVTGFPPPPLNSSHVVILHHAKVFSWEVWLSSETLGLMYSISHSMPDAALPWSPHLTLSLLFLDLWLRKSGDCGEKAGSVLETRADLLSCCPGHSLCSSPFCSFKSYALYGTNPSQAVSAQHLRRRLGRSGVISNNHIPNKQDAPFSRTNRKHANKPTNHQKYKLVPSSQGF